MTEAVMNGQASQSEAFQGWNANHFYRGKVVRQLTNVDAKNVPFLSLAVKVEGMLLDLRNVDSGLVKCPEAEVEVRLRFDENNTQHMEYSIQDLMHLGFADEDLSKLDPGHPEHVSFVGTTVYVTPTYKATGKGTMCFWNLRFPENYKLESGGVDLIAQSGAAQVFRTMMQARRQGGGDSPPPARKGGRKKKEESPF